VAAQPSSGEAPTTRREPTLAELEAYAAQLDASRARELRPRRADPGLRRLGKWIVPQRYRRPARAGVTRLRAGRERKRAADIAASPQPLKLHLGSGPMRKQGWTNVDLVGDNVDLAWDL
jgi:hypothetical protein